MRKRVLTACFFPVILLSYSTVPLFSVETIKYSGCGIVKKALMDELAKKVALSREGRQIISDQNAVNVREGTRLWKW